MGKAGTSYRRGDVRYVVLAKHHGTDEAFCYMAFKHPDGSGYVVMYYSGTLTDSTFQETEEFTEVIDFYATAKAAGRECEVALKRSNACSWRDDAPDEWLPVVDPWEYIKHLDD